eukprot:TRINITY_DN4368_c0_g1_i1.p1 TRINITY_DN4368_c0_g1~~TRINITY_DN4368_c0_g1_i1.p1  ORF type:complete len:1860 (+),score=391.75 TRINITY_DN4368_c0_g1_i1:249-5828(+)
MSASDGSTEILKDKLKVQEWLATQEEDYEAKVVERWYLHVYTIVDIHRVVAKRVLGEHRAVYNINASPLWVIGSRGKLRKNVISLIDWPAFDAFILVTIIINCVVEVLDTPSFKDYEWANRIRFWSELLFLAIFTAEAALKIMGRGFALHRKSYLRDPWNVIDFLILIASFAIMVLKEEGTLSVIRTVRVIRPLRAFRRAKGLRVLITAITESLPVLLDVLLLLFLIIFMFSILGVQLWKGKLHQRCYAYSTTSPIPFPILVANETDPCGEGRTCGSLTGYAVECQIHTTIFENTITNFDNIAMALFQVITVVTLDDWPDEMFVVQDASNTWAWLYFVSLTLIGGYFLLHMVVAVLYVSYADTRRRTSITHVVVHPAKIGISPMSQGVYAYCTPKFSTYKHKLNFTKKPQANIGAPALRAEDAVQKYFGVHKYQEDYLKDVKAEVEMQAEMERWDHKVTQLQEIMTAEHLPGGAREIEERYIPNTLRVDNLLGLDVLHMLLALACPHAVIPAPRLPIDEESSLATDTSDLSWYSESKEPPSTIYLLVTNPWFGHFMLGVTVVSVIAMATDYHGITAEHSQALDAISYAATGIFIVEVVLKIVGLGLKGYIADRLNVLDFVVLTISIPDLFVTSTGITALRAFRVLRLIGYMSDSQKHLLSAVGASLPEIGTLLFLEVLLVFMFSLLGLSLFEGKYPPGYRENFNSLWEAFLTVFIMLTGDGWTRITKTGMEAASPWSFLYFVAFFFFGTVIAMSMFPVILIDRMTDEVRRKKKAQQLEAMREIDDLGLSMAPNSLSEAILKENETEKQKNTKWKITLLAAGTAMAAHRKARQEVTAKEVLGNWTAEISLKHARPFWINKVTGMKKWSNPISELTAEDHSVADIEPKAAVEVWWCGEWYNGTVIGRREDGSYTVVYRDTGEVSIGIDPSYIRLAMNVGNPLIQHSLNYVAKQIQDLPLHTIFTLPDLGGITLLWCALSDKGKRKLEQVWSDPAAKEVLLEWLAMDGTLVRTPQPKTDEPVNPLDAVFPKKVKIVEPAKSCDASLDADNKGLGGGAMAVTQTRHMRSDNSTTASFNDSKSMRLRSMRFGGSSDGSEVRKNRDNIMTTKQLTAGRSLGFFSKQSKVRRAISAVVLHRWFDDFMLLVIFVNAIFLALDDYYADERPGGRKLLNTANIIFVVLYLSEMVAKIIALGLYKAPNAYFKSTWNKVDAVVAVAQIIELTKLGVGTQLRGARTIRLLVRLSEVRVVCEMLLKVLPDVLKVGLVYVLVWVIFSVIGVSVFKGHLQGCNDVTALYEADCVGVYQKQVGDMFSATATQTTAREWSTYRLSFDNIWETVLTLLELASLEGWSDLMWRVIDAGSEKGPVRNANPWRSLYFVSYIIIAHFYLVALFVGTLVNAFHDSQHKESALMTVKQRMWSRMRRLITTYDLEWRPKVPMKHEWNGVRIKCYLINENQKFDIIIYTLIGLNCIMLATTAYQMSPRQENILHIANIIFIIIFIIEALIRWAALGFKGYMRDPWNRFDLFCITMSVAGLILSLNTTVLRVARVIRGLRLLRKADRLKQLVDTLYRSLPALLNVSLLLLYIFFNWGIVGVSMFKDIKPNPLLTRHESFKTLPSAILILYQIATTETWTDLMEGTSIRPPHCEEEAGNCGNRAGSVLYFSSAMMVGSFIFLNLFIYVVLESFIETRRELYGMAHDEFFGAFKLFRNLWTDVDPSLTRRVSVDEFLEILQKLPDPLWQGEVGGDKAWLNLLRNIRFLPIPVTLDREVSFDDCVFALAMKAVGIRKKDVSSGPFSSLVDPSLFTLEDIVAARRIECLFHRWKRRQETAIIHKEKAKANKVTAALGGLKTPRGKREGNKK